MSITSQNTNDESPIRGYSNYPAVEGWGFRNPNTKSYYTKKAEAA